jgi:hypothetical protein
MPYNIAIHQPRHRRTQLTACAICGLVMASVSGTQHRMKRSRIRLQASGLSAMSALLKSIEEQARALSAEDRARLAESMLESLHTSIAEIEALWAEEIEERVSAFDRGEIPSYSAEEVFAEALQTLQ